MRAMLALVLALSTLVHGASVPFDRKFSQVFSRGQDLLSKSFARSLPTPAPSSGVRYSFDAATATFVREAAVLGQVYVDRATTLGRGRWNLGVTYQRGELDRIGKQEADRLPGGEAIRLHPGMPEAVRLPDAAISIVANRVAFAVSYGVTDDLDLSVVVPIVQTRFAARFDRDVALIREGIAAAGYQPVRDKGHPVGIGDVLLYAKHALPKLGSVDVASSLAVRFPTGSVEDQHGGGGYDVTPGLRFTTPLVEVRSWARLQGHLNAGVALLAEDVGASEPHWALGLDWGVSDGVTLGVSVLGRHPLRRTAPPGTLDLRRCGPTLAGCLADAYADRPSRPLYGLDTGRPDYYDFAIGGRVSLWRDIVIGFASVVIPLNDAGARADPIPLVGVEATF